MGTFTAVVPLAPQLPDTSVDSARNVGLAMAAAKGFVFGRSVVSLFGPYAAAQTGAYTPQTDAASLLASGCIALALTCCIFSIARGSARAIAAAFALTMPLAGREAVLFLVPFAFLLVTCCIAMPASEAASIRFSRNVRLTLLLCGPALGILCLIEFPAGAVASAAIIVSLVSLVRQGHARFAGLMTLLFGASVATFWALANQPLLAFGRYVTTQAQIALDLAQITSTLNNRNASLLFAAFCIFLGIIYTPFLRRGGSRAAVIWVFAGLILYFAFKADQARSVPDFLVPTSALAGIAWLLAIRLPSPGAIVGLALALGLWAGFERFDRGGFDSPALGSLLLQRYIQAAGGLGERIMTPDRLEGDYQASLDSIRSTQLLPPINGSVNASTARGNALIIARHLQWSANPGLPSANSASPELERLNANYLVGSEAPTYLLVSIESQGDELPALDNGLSWPPMLTRYAIVARRGDYTLLHRRAIPTATQPIDDAPITSGTYHLGKPMMMPIASRPIWAKIDLRPTPLGYLLGMLYGLPTLSITYRWRSGAEHRYAYNAKLGSAGFLASPLITDTTDLFALEMPMRAGYFHNRVPQSITISADDGMGTLWASSFRARFFALAVPSSANAARVFDRIAAYNFAWNDASLSKACDFVVTGPQGIGSSPTRERFMRAVGWVTAQGPAEASDRAIFVLQSRGAILGSFSARKIAFPAQNDPVSTTPYVERFEIVTQVGKLNLDSILGFEFVHDGQRSRCAVERTIARGPRSLRRNRLHVKSPPHDAPPSPA